MLFKCVISIKDSVETEEDVRAAETEQPSSDPLYSVNQ